MLAANSTSVALAIIDQRLDLLDEHARDLLERIQDLRQIRQVVLRDLQKVVLESAGPEPAFEPGDRAEADRRRPKARQLREWLASYGPATRKSIRDNTGLHSGTINNYLKPKFGFVLVGRGLWDIPRHGTRPPPAQTNGFSEKLAGASLP